MKKITLEQKEIIQGTLCAPDMYFNCIQDINNEWFVSVIECDLSDLQWLKDIPLTAFVPKITKSPLEN